MDVQERRNQNMQGDETERLRKLAELQRDEDLGKLEERRANATRQVVVVVYTWHATVRVCEGGYCHVEYTRDASECYVVRRRRGSGGPWCTKCRRHGHTMNSKARPRDVVAAAAATAPPPPPPPPPPPHVSICNIEAHHMEAAIPRRRADGHHDYNRDGNHIPQACPFFEQTKADRVAGEAHRSGIVRQKGSSSLNLTIKVIEWPDGTCVCGGLDLPSRALRAPLLCRCSHL